MLWHTALARGRGGDSQIRSGAVRHASRVVTSGYVATLATPGSPTQSAVVGTRSATYCQPSSPGTALPPSRTGHRCDESRSRPALLFIRDALSASTDESSTGHRPRGYAALIVGHAAAEQRHGLAAGRAYPRRRRACRGWSRGERPFRGGSGEDGAGADRLTRRLAPLAGAGVQAAMAPVVRTLVSRETLISRSTASLRRTRSAGVRFPTPDRLHGTGVQLVRIIGRGAARDSRGGISRAHSEYPRPRLARPSLWRLHLFPRSRAGAPATVTRCPVVPRWETPPTLL